MLYSHKSPLFQRNVIHTADISLLVATRGFRSSQLMEKSSSKSQQGKLFSSRKSSAVGWGGIHQFSRNLPELSSLAGRNHREEQERSLSFCRILILVSSLLFCHIFAFWHLQPQSCQLRAAAPPDTKIYIFFSLHSLISQCQTKSCLVQSLLLQTPVSPAPSFLSPA